MLTRGCSCGFEAPRSARGLNIHPKNVRLEMSDSKLVRNGAGRRTEGERRPVGHAEEHKLFL